MHQSHQAINPFPMSWESVNREMKSRRVERTVKSRRVDVISTCPWRTRYSFLISTSFCLTSQIWRHQCANTPALFFSSSLFLLVYLSLFLDLNFGLTLSLSRALCLSLCSKLSLNELQIMFKCSQRHFQLFRQSFCLVNYYQHARTHTHTQMQTALSGSLSRAFGTWAAVPSLSCNE